MAFIFEINEYLPQEHKLTDYQIARVWADEFPKLKIPKKILDYHSGKLKYEKLATVTAFRNKYNLGQLFSQKGSREGPISFPYNGNGIRISYQGNPLSQEKIKEKLERYGPDRRDRQQFDWETVAMFAKAKRRKGRPTYESFDWCI